MAAVKHILRYVKTHDACASIIDQFFIRLVHVPGTFIGPTAGRYFYLFTRVQLRHL